MIYLIIAISALLVIIWVLFKMNISKAALIREKEESLQASMDARQRLANILWEVRELEEERKKKNHQIDSADSDELLNLVNGLFNDNSSGGAGSDSNTGTSD